MRQIRINATNSRRPKVAIKMPRSQVRNHIDREAHKRLGISGREMLQQYRRGTLHEVGRVADLIVWADALADDDPMFEG
jgi:hypothetical protein